MVTSIISIKEKQAIASRYTRISSWLKHASSSANDVNSLLEQVQSICSPGAASAKKTKWNLRSIPSLLRASYTVDCLLPMYNGLPFKRQYSSRPKSPDKAPSSHEEHEGHSDPLATPAA
ncbi:hypothetical protein IAQ61_001920 [Plenodomus lingam]|uniref:uncharacterized protein n=1 Tax=Leptosphaeria maculans TaxID=5022 RepID=UPI00331C30AB|nr:hypothetical protein IAQ61_001920 [Plenodomus lingam]